MARAHPRDADKVTGYIQSPGRTTAALRYIRPARRNIRFTFEEEPGVLYQALLKIFYITALEGQFPDLDEVHCFIRSHEFS